jgi:Cu/Ag efflux pump CusA
LAVAVIFGLAFATALTLVVVPVVVWVMEKMERERGGVGELKKRTTESYEALKDKDSYIVKASFSGYSV